MSLKDVDGTIESLGDLDDLVSWVNNTLDPQVGDLPALEQHITQIVASLDIACEETSFRLERVIDDASRGIPRLTYDLHFMKDSALTLRSVLTKAQDHSRHSVQSETSDALEQLRVLDTMKRNMELSRDVLREAESWSSLEMEVTALLAERSYDKAAERLSEASKSMVVFQNTPEYDSRRTLMVSLQNQLEAALSSALVAAINTQDVDLCRNYFNIFTNIQRESEFRNYYNGSRKAPLNEMWLEFSESSSSQKLSDFLPKFYSRFLTLLNTERVFMPAVFPDPQQSLSSLIISVLSTLQPSFSERLSTLSDQHGHLTLVELIASLKATQDFAIGVQKMMEKIKVASPNPPQMNSDNQSRERLHRRRSSRMSISWRPGPQRTPAGGASSDASKHADFGQDGLDWDRELFQPFLDYQVEYGNLERKTLQEAFDLVKSKENPKTIVTDKARLMRESAIDLFSIGEESFARCIAFTFGYGAVGLIQALDAFIESFFLSHIKDTESQDGPSTQSYQSYEGLTDLDYTSKNWASLQQALHSLNAARAIYERLISFESKLRIVLEQAAAHFALAEADPVNSTVAPLRGQDAILQGSLLYSAELHTLIDGVRRPSQPTSTSDNTLLVSARAGLYAFVKSCQASLQDTILSPLRKQLENYPSLPLWSVSGDSKSKTISSGMVDLHVPTFSLSPSETVQKVSEGLLNLPRLFEVYASDDALSFSLETLPYIDVDVLKGFSEDSHVEPTHAPRHIRRTSLINVQPTPRVVLDAETVTSAWLSSLGHTLLSYLMGDVLPRIDNLSDSGASQLASDLSYLSNILSALNVSSDDLGKWQEYATIPRSEGIKRIANSSANVDTVLSTVAGMRGWNLS